MPRATLQVVRSPAKKKRMEEKGERADSYPQTLALQTVLKVTSTFLCCDLRS